jgi:hypothetical protein
LRVGENGEKSIAKMFSRLKIIADSAAGLGMDIASEFNIGGKTYRDGLDPGPEK